MYLGDNVIADGITALVDDYRKLGCNSQILLAKVPNPSQFGVAELENGRVVRLTEKPKQPKSDLALVGVYMFDDTIFEAVKAIRPSAAPGARDHRRDPVARGPRQERPPAPRHGLVEGHRQDRGHARGQPHHPRHVHRRAASRASDAGCRVEGKVVIEPGAKLANATVRGPAVIGAGRRDPRRLRRPVHGRSAPDCVVDRCEIENSIVLEGSRLERIPVRIADSLIGKNVRIHPGAERPRVHRFLVGDNSEIGIV